MPLRVLFFGRIRATGVVIEILDNRATGLLGSGTTKAINNFVTCVRGGAAL